MYKNNYKVFFLLLLVLFSFNSCTNKKNTSKKTIEAQKNIAHSQKDYHLFYRFEAIPYEIMINDVMCEIDFENGMPGPTEINHYLLKSGNQKIKIKVIHPYAHENMMFKPKDVEFLNKNLFIADVSYNDQNEIELDTIKKLDFPKIEVEVPFIEYEWSFKVEVPYKLNAWSNSENLNNWNKEDLKEKVLSKFNYLRNLLNSGNGIRFVEELKYANKEYFKANYFTKKQENEYLSNLTRTYSNHKGIMPQINKFDLKIMGDGKVVTLQNIDKNIGQSVLTAEDSKKKILYLNYIMLHKPKNSEEFEIIRYNSNITSLDKE